MNKFFMSRIYFSLLPAACVFADMPAVCDFSMDRRNSSTNTQNETYGCGELPSCGNGSYQATVSAQHREGKGIGYKHGYSSLDLLWNLHPTADIHPFLDLRGHITNDGKWAANAGVGFRKLIQSKKVIVGANVFYDYSDVAHSAFHQIGAGFESFYKNWDFHLNGYFPVSNTKKIYKNGFSKFSGHRAIFAKNYDIALTGGDLSFGRQLFTTRYFDMHSKLGGYFFSGDFSKKAVGGLFRLKSYITPYFSIEGQASYDSLFKGVYQGMVALNFPFGGKSKSNTLFSCNARSMQAVDRFEIIVTKTHKRKSSAIDPATGKPLFFVFVDNTHPSSDGSINSPYPTLVEAQNNSAPGDIIYVFAGDGTSTGMDQGITLKTRQQLIGSGAPITFDTRFGIRTIPAQTVNLPVLTNVNASPVIVLPSGNMNNVISGLDIQGVLAAPIGIGGVENLQLLNSKVFSSSGGVGTASGIIVIENNHFSGGTAPILDVTQDAKILFKNNVSSISGQGPTLSCSDFAHVEIDVIGNSVDGLGTAGTVLGINSSDSAELFVSIIDNVVTNGHHGIITVNQGNSSVKFVIQGNSCSNTSIPYLIQVLGSAVVSVDFENNNSVNSANSITFTSDGASSMAIRMFNNNTTDTGGAPGFTLTNTSSFPMVVQSADTLISGVAEFNTGTSNPPFTSTNFGSLTTTGEIQYVPPFVFDQSP